MYSVFSPASFIKSFFDCQPSGWARAWLVPAGAAPPANVEVAIELPTGREIVVPLHTPSVAKAMARRIFPFTMAWLVSWSTKKLSPFWNRAPWWIQTQETLVVAENPAGRRTRLWKGVLPHLLTDRQP